MQLAANLREDGLRDARSLLEDNATIATLRAEKFDLVLRDIISWHTALLSQILGVPEIDTSSTGNLVPFFAPRYLVPNPVAYVPQMNTYLIPRLVGRLQAVSPHASLLACTSRSND